MFPHWFKPTMTSTITPMNTSPLMASRTARMMPMYPHPERPALTGRRRWSGELKDMAFSVNQNGAALLSSGTQLR